MVAITRELCIAFLAGSALGGAGIAVAPKAKQALVKAKPAPAVKRKVPAPKPTFAAASIAKTAPLIIECVPSGSPFSSEWNPPAFPNRTVAPGSSPVFGGDPANNIFDRDPLPIVRPNTPPETVAPSVPEPATWGMLVIGFGAVGLSLRKGRHRNDLHPRSSPRPL